MDSLDGHAASPPSILLTGEIVRSQPIPHGSNYTYLITILGPDGEYPAIYKPRRGEAPLWDFPDGSLYRREYAAYLVSQALGWPDIPDTVIRDGPLGVGSVQWFIESQVRESYFTFREQRVDELQHVAAFDALVNNADRKGGHCLLGRDGRVWCIDHGLTFHPAPKLRTVIWDFAGEPLPASITDDLGKLAAALDRDGILAAPLRKLITDEELDALRRRLDGLLTTRTFPLQRPGRNIPWPPL